MASQHLMQTHSRTFFYRFSDEHDDLHESMVFKPGYYGLYDEAPPFMTSVTPLHERVQVLSCRLMTALALSLS